MWAQDVAAMFGYHAEASAVAAVLTPFPSTLQALAGLPGPGPERGWPVRASPARPRPSSTRSVGRA
ncbi:hypothetical protein BZL29_6529 [Mycobacterium kansasii]|uniref:PPE family protein n=1 Tax=Mycobacterium kansasii TaxID=1768 RepID=A0A1V3WM52_MYCKA|nr:hypothetical protein BZL29_6529 [Mycobacterium kansasii]